MCDYSLMHFPNRLAREGEKLVTHRFSTGCIGLIEAASRHTGVVTKLTGMWSALSAFRRDLVDPPCAICVPPGATLRTRDGVVVVFTQGPPMPGWWRDGIAHPDGRNLLLQNLGAGIELTVVSLELATEPERVNSEAVPWSPV